MKAHSFSKEQRILKHKEFLELKSKGLVFKTKKLIFNFRYGGEISKIGVIVTKKVGNAVFRNRVKRWLREIFRLNSGVFTKPVSLVIIPRSSDLSYERLKSDFLFFAKWCNEKNFSDSN